MSLFLFLIVLQVFKKLLQPTELTDFIIAAIIGMRDDSAHSTTVAIYTLKAILRDHNLAFGKVRSSGNRPESCPDLTVLGDSPDAFLGKTCPRVAFWKTWAKLPSWYMQSVLWKHSVNFQCYC